METDVICAECGKVAGKIVCDEVKRAGKVYKVKGFQAKMTHYPNLRFEKEIMPLIVSNEGVKNVSMIPFCSEGCKVKYLE